MTVAELIAKLQELDPELEVLIEGYEGGYDSAERIKGPYHYRRDVNADWYYGPHAEADGPSDSDFEGVVIV